MVLCIFWQSANGAVIFRSGEIDQPEDRWEFDLGMWEVDPDSVSPWMSVGFYRIDGFADDPELGLSFSGGGITMESLPNGAAGVGLRGNAGAIYHFGVNTVIEYPATSFGFDLFGDSLEWEFQLVGYDFSGGLEVRGVLDSRRLEGDRSYSWTVEQGAVSYWRLSNQTQVELAPLIIGGFFQETF